MPRAPQTIDRLLADPLIQAVMRADHVETVALKRMLDGVAARRSEPALDLTRARVRFACQTEVASDADDRDAPVRC